MAPFAGRATTERIIAQIREVARSLGQTPHRGSLRDEIMPGLRAIPAGRRGVIVFTVDDAAREVFVHVIAHGGADWIGRAPGRTR
jgi:plasmid stabilization system protein ParE